MKGDDTWAAVAAALRRGALSGGSTPPVHVEETHISCVFVGAHRAYKLLKPVVLPYLDYGTPARRLEMCRRSVELNRRLAPRVYLRVVAVAHREGHLTLAEAADPDAVEYLIEMAPFAEGDLLVNRINARSVTDDDLRSVGETLGRYHRDAHPAPSGRWPDDVARWWRGRLDAVREGEHEGLDPGAVDAVEQFVERFLAVEHQRLAAREANGWIREGHGDLRLEHVLLTEPVQLVDCVEFDAALRRLDVLSDLAFLVMELEVAERPDLIRTLVASWADEVPALDWRLLYFYAAGKALVRSEVALDRARGLDDPLRRKVACDIARERLRLALRLTWSARPPMVIVVGGLSGSGKTTIARLLAGRAGIDRLSSDETRKALVGIDSRALAPPEAYLDGVSTLVYHRLGLAAADRLRAGRSCVVDATFRRALDAEAFERAFVAAGGDRTAMLPVVLVAEDHTLRQRVEDRADPAGSDAGPEVLALQLREREAHVVQERAAVVGSEGAIPDVLARVERLALDAAVR